jgi:hypothetical protein
VDEISTFVHKEVSTSFLKQLFAKQRRILRIESYYRRIGASIDSFEASGDAVHTTSIIDPSCNNRYQNLWTFTHGIRRTTMRLRLINES